MTEQERFEADYLAAFPMESRSDIRIEDRATRHALLVWQQQAARHKAEIAALVNALKETRRELSSCKSVIAYAGGFDPDYVRGANDAIKSANEAIAKYEEKQ